MRSSHREFQHFAGGEKPSSRVLGTLRKGHHSHTTHSLNQKLSCIGFSEIQYTVTSRYLTYPKASSENLEMGPECRLLSHVNEDLS